MTRNKQAGFTMIEMLVVLVIMGVLAAFAVNGYGDAINKTHIASMRSDLKDLITVEAGFLVDSGYYSSAVDENAMDGVTPGSILFVPTEGNQLTVLQTTNATTQEKGWTGRMTRADTPVGCSVFIGSVPLAPATKPGAVACQ